MASPYYDKRGVFYNRLGISDARQLQRAEYVMAGARAVQLLLGQVALPPDWGAERLRAIHRHLFQDVYEWAGAWRSAPASKRMAGSMVSVFAMPQELASRVCDVEQRVQDFLLHGAADFKQKCRTLADIFIAANHIHPFPEGNGRSLQIFITHLAAAAGIALDWRRVQAAEWNRASAISGVYGILFEGNQLVPEPPDRAPIREIFARMAAEVSEKPLQGVSARRQA